MARRRNFLLTGAPAALVLALGAAACSEAERDQAGADIETAAEEVGEAVEAAAEEVGEAVEAALEEADAALQDLADSGRTPAPAGASVSFANLADGDVVQSPLGVEFAADGIDVVPAGDQTEHTGHHHLLIDTTADSLDLSQPIPNDEQHLHFGMAQTGTTVELTPGAHTLQLVMGDWTHIPHDPVVASEVITVTVE